VVLKPWPIRYIPENVGRVLYDSLKILGLSLGASERDVKVAYLDLAQLYHPDKWEEAHHTTGMMLAETTAHFQLLNNAQSHLLQVLIKIRPYHISSSFSFLISPPHKKSRSTICLCFPPESSKRFIFKTNSNNTPLPPPSTTMTPQVV
jgi:hypothetical protein